MAPGRGLYLDGSRFQFQPLYQEEADNGLLIGRHTVRRVDLSSGVRRRKRRAWLYDLHDNGNWHIGIYTAFHDYDAHGSVTH